MFENKNKNDHLSDITNLNQNNDFPIGDFPTHTMRDDLEKIARGELPSPTDEIIEPVTKAEPSVDPKAQNSPFLHTGEAPVRPISQPSQPSESSPKDTVGKIPTDQPQEGMQKKSNFLVVSVLSVLLVILFIAGGYYFWTTRQMEQTDEPSIIVDEPTSEDTIPKEEPEVKIPTFSIETPNYLPLEITNTESASVLSALQKLSQDVAASKATVPIEFVVTDAKNAPVALTDFLKKLNVAFSAKTMASFSGNFSLYFYNDTTGIKIALSLESNNPVALKNLMLTEEKALPTTFKSLFFNPEVTLPTTGFATGTYKEIPIRYLNVTSPESLSIDYAIVEKELIIGTSKMTTRAIIDKIGVIKPSSSEQTQTSPVLPPPPTSEAKTPPAAMPKIP